MKNYLSIYLIGIIALFTVTSCSVNDQEEISEIEDQIAPPPLLLCTYEGGFQTGLSDYEAYYNDAVEQLGIDECSKVRVEFTAAGENSVGTVKAAYTSNHAQIMQLVDVISQGYRDYLIQYQNSSNVCKKGQHDGFFAVYGQQPFASANDDCSNKGQGIN